MSQSLVVGLVAIVALFAAAYSFAVASTPRTGQVVSRPVLRGALSAAAGVLTLMLFLALVAHLMGVSQ